MFNDIFLFQLYMAIKKKIYARNMFIHFCFDSMAAYKPREFKNCFKSLKNSLSLLID